MQAEAGAANFAADGGSGQIRITTNRECNWSARTDAPWVQIAPPGSGQGDGSVQFTVASHGDPAARSAAINIEDSRVVVSQEGRRCEFRLSSTVETIDPTGGERTVQVEASSAQCRWTAASQEDWIVVTAGAEGTGNGAVRFRVTAAAGAARAGTVTIAGQAVRVEQGTGPSTACTYTIGRTRIEFGIAGGRGEIPVSTAPGCSWTAQPSVPWITILGNPTSSGPGVLGFRVDPTDGPIREGTITIAGLAATVVQAPGCTYSVDPATYAAPAAGGSVAISVRTAAGCDWSASIAGDWVRFTSPSTGTGPGEIRVAIGANAGPARTATLGIATQQVTLNQASGCTYTVNPGSLTVGAGASTGTIQVGAGSGCAWSAASAASWVSIASGANGEGNGQVQYSVSANIGPARETSLTIAGRQVPVAQASGCTYAITPNVVDVGAAGGSGAVSVATGPGCPWTATSPEPWATLSPPSGSGPAQVAFAAAANGGPARSAALAIAGHPFTLNQASPCVWALVPPSHVFGPEGGTGAILVIVSGACTWTTVSNAPWITVTNGAAGSGGGLVQFTVAPNPGGPRTGTMTLAGQRYEVMQAGR